MSETEQAIETLLNIQIVTSRRNGKTIVSYAISKAIQALQEKAERENHKLLTMEELLNRTDPVWVGGDGIITNGYWCLCDHGYILPPSGYEFKANDGNRRHWKFYNAKPLPEPYEEAEE